MSLWLGMKSGLDPATIYKAISDGAGSSRMFQVRGPLMVRGEYEPATMKVGIWQKDMKIIGEFATRLACPTPLFAASASFYNAAMAQGLVARIRPQSARSSKTWPNSNAGRSSNVPVVAPAARCSNDGPFARQ